MDCYKIKSLGSFAQKKSSLRDVSLARISYFSQSFRGVVVCCSGGADSTALFHFLYDLTKEKKNFSLAICHVNFGLRNKESDQDEVFLKS